MWFYKMMCVIMLATGTVQGSTFTTNTAITNWENAPCKLAVPSPKYSIDKHWTVDEPHLPIPKNGLWIGYVYGQVAFDYLGCSSDCTENTTDVKSVGECHLMCRGKAFGIQKAESIDSFRCCCRHYTGSLLSKSCNDQCGDDGMFLCGKKDSENNSFSIYGITNVSAFNNNTESFVCLDFNYPNFIWASCKGPSKGLMCSNVEVRPMGYLALVTHIRTGQV
ncbi:uncharacterized protein LOC127859662 [Dreissena polymorpha]|uniref:uncharacterized protein LOC127859662 n=1 Tax=Dreissena polymorpha TaxID=45954 RepID=UPI002264D7C0|nr:uncharacterized protein LOC127859662 [Dreissena polymorpha]